MSIDERIQNIEAFIHTLEVVRGLRFRVLSENDGREFIIEFAEASKRQLMTLNNILIRNEVLHIRSRAIKVLEFDTPKRKRRNGKR